MTTIADYYPTPKSATQAKPAPAHETPPAAIDLRQQVAVIPSTDALIDPEFIRQAQTLSCVIVNAAEPQRHVEVRAQMFLKATDYQTELVVLDGEDPATVWADQRFRAVPRFPKTVWHALKCGTVFATRYSLARLSEGRTPHEALAQSLDAVEAHIESAQATTNRDRANGKRPGPASNLGEFDSVRNAEFARALAMRKCLC